MSVHAQATATLQYVQHCQYHEVNTHTLFRRSSLCFSVSVYSNTHVHAHALSRSLFSEDAIAISLEAPMQALMVGKTGSYYNFLSAAKSQRPQIVGGRHAS